MCESLRAWELGSLRAWEFKSLGAIVCIGAYEKLLSVCVRAY